MPDNTVKVDRTTPWGNPYIVGKHGTRAECMYFYKLLMAGCIVFGTADPDAQCKARDYVAKNREQLRGKNLACWCAECHADVLLEIANRAT